MSSATAIQWLVAAMFALFVAATVGGALLAVLTARVIRAVCGLAICCFGLAGLYYFLHSPFLALMEILIYVGAVCITIVFAIMLAEPEEAPEPDSSKPILWGLGALLVSAGILWGVARLGLQHPWTLVHARPSDGTLETIGISLLTTYSLPFEAISLVLLVAILGALVIARAGRDKA